MTLRIDIPSSSARGDVSLEEADEMRKWRIRMRRHRGYCARYSARILEEVSESALALALGGREYVPLVRPEAERQKAVERRAERQWSE
jgi:hypothetical protein